jgi:hypothetical protein
VWNFVTFEVLTAVNMKITVFWAVMPCSLEIRFQHFGEAAPIFKKSIRLHAISSQKTVIFLRNFCGVTIYSSCGNLSMTDMVLKCLNMLMRRTEQAQVKSRRMKCNYF